MKFNNVVVQAVVHHNREVADCRSLYVLAVNLVQQVQAVVHRKLARYRPAGSADCRRMRSAGSFVVRHSTVVASRDLLHLLGCPSCRTAAVGYRQALHSVDIFDWHQPERTEWQDLVLDIAAQEAEVRKESMTI